MAPFYKQNLLLACEEYFLRTISGQGVDVYLMPVLQILHNGMSFSETSSVHVWNVFYNESLTDVENSIFSAKSELRTPNTLKMLFS